MFAQSALPAGSLPSSDRSSDRSSLGWLILIPLGCLVLGQLLLALTSAVPVLDGTLADPDAYMRLARVLHLHDSGAWFDSRFLRIDPPHGHVQHWTRPLDALLLAGAWLLQPLLGFDQALYVWGVLISPVCLAIALVTLAWAAAPILDRDARVFACLALLLQPAVLGYSSLGRPDHHSLLLLLFVALLGLTARLLCDPLARGAAVAAGLIGALAIWVSPEALVFVAPSLAVLGLCWLQGDPGMAGKVERYLVALSLGLGLGLFLERGPAGLAAIENDRLSLVHLALFGALTLGWMLIVRASRRLAPSPWGERLTRVESRGAPLSAAPGRAQWTGIVVRTALAIAGALGVAATMLLLFPHLRDGPLGHVDPLYARVRLHRILEIQPLLSPRWLAEGEVGMAIHRVVRFIGIAIPAVAYLVVLLVRERGATRRIWGWVALVLGIFLGLTFYQVRWASYTQVLLVLPYSALIGGLLGRVSERAGTRSAPLFRAPLIAVSLFWPMLLSQLMPQAKIELAGEACPISRLAPALNRALAGESGTILAFADFGPEILYRTGLSVLSIPNHRPQPGFTATYRALTARDDRTARAILADHRVDWILLCPSPVERSVFEPEDGGHGHLYERLADGPVPPWVRPIPLPDDLANSARLFEVVPEPALVGRRHDAASRS